MDLMELMPRLVKDQANKGVYVMKHLIQNAATVDATVLALWKAFKYSSIKASVFSNAQEAEGFEKLKLLKASLIRWLSHGAASYCIQPLNIC